MLRRMLESLLVVVALLWVPILALLVIALLRDRSGAGHEGLAKAFFDAVDHMRNREG